MTSASEPAERIWTPAMEIGELWEGDMAGVDVNGAKVLLVNVDGDVQAFRNSCPHQESNLDEGEFEDGRSPAGATSGSSTPGPAPASTRPTAP